MHAGRQASPLLIEERERLAQRVARRDGRGERRRAQPVEVVELLRRHGLASSTRLDSCIICAAARRARRSRSGRPGWRGRRRFELTMTSYCLPSRLKRVTWRPPSMVSSVRPMVSTRCPASAALSRSMSTVSCGLFSLRSVSRLASPGCCRAAAMQLVHRRLQLAHRAASLQHELHRLVVGALAERRRVDRERQHAGDAANILRRDRGDDLLLLARLRSSQSFRRMKLMTLG